MNTFFSLIRSILIGILFLFSSNLIYAQTYTENRESFVKVLMNKLEVIKSETPRNFVRDELKVMLLETSDFSDEYFKRVVETCNLIESKKLSVYPEIYFYVYSVYSIIKTKQSAKSFSAWQGTTEKLLASKNASRFKEFIDISSDFFNRKILFESNEHVWSYRSGDFSFDIQDKPIIKFSNGKLVCLLRNSFGNSNTYLDSIVINQTTGVFDLFSGAYVGSGGTLNWSKVGLDPKKTFCKLFHYSVNTKYTRFNCDTVEMNTPYFEKPILGKLNDMVIQANREVDKEFPKFFSFNRNLTIKNISEGVDYIGSYSQRGAEFVGIGYPNSPASFIVNVKNKPFIKIASQYVSIDPKQIISNKSQITIYIAQKDSIYHPGLDVKYIFSDKAIDFTPPSVGSIVTPFFSSYHNLEMFVPKLQWIKGVDELYFSYNVGSQEQRKARFESKNMYNAKQYEEIQGLDKVNPLASIAKYCIDNNKNVLKDAELSTSLNKVLSEAKTTFLNLHILGFINYDSEKGVITVKEKLFNFVNAKSDKIDYDYLIFNCEMNPVINGNFTEEKIKANKEIANLVRDFKKLKEERGKLKNFGVLNINNFEIKLYAIDKVELSPVQKTTVIPSNSMVTIYKNRDFSFNGFVESGKMLIRVYDGYFNYEKNKIDLIKSGPSFFSVAPLTEKDGKSSIMMTSSVYGIKGALFIDDSTNRSGKSKLFTDFPKIKVENRVKVFYAQKDLYKGAYDSARFYFDVYPFDLDSLDNFKESSFKLKGELNSAGIFPILKQELKIMNDYSFGFVQESPPGGYDFYSTGAKYENKIVLSNRGLEGSGKIDFIQSRSISKAFVFLPDSTVGYATFENKPIETGVQFPDVRCSKAYIAYMPRLKKLKAYSTDTLLSFFNNEAQLNGTAIVAPQGMTGNGLMSFEVAAIGSRLFKFNRWEMDADTSTFNLFNKKYLSTEDNEKIEPYSLVTDNIKSHVSFKNRTGEFISNAGQTIVNFPVNQYSCTMDKFEWNMDKENIDLSTKDKNLVASKSENLVSNMFSINTRQDSLQFRTSLAVFDLKENVIYCKDAKYVDVADARIYPDKGVVTIREKAKMDPLEKSLILANRTTRFHKFVDASTIITSRQNYSARGIYPYYDSDSVKTDLVMESIGVDDSLRTTVAYGKISDSIKFKFNKQFEYHGGIKINAPTSLISFKGSTRIFHTCNKFERSWISFQADIDRKDIQIPIMKDQASSNGTTVSSGLMWRDSQTIDSVKIYPVFLSNMVRQNDPVILSSFGILRYNKDSSIFQLASMSKLQNRTSKGDYLSLNTKSCELIGAGKIDFGLNLGVVSVDAFGDVKYTSTTGKSEVNATAKFTIPIDNGLLGDIANKIKSDEAIVTADLNNTNFFYALNNWVDKKEYDKISNLYSEEKILKRVPDELEKGLVISGLKFVSFDKKASQDKGLISTTENATLVSINDDVVMKEFPIKVFLYQVYSENVSGDKLGIYLNSTFGKDYFFKYEMAKKEGELKLFSEDDEFNSLVSSIKPEKRKSSNFSYEITDNRIYMSSFLKLFNK